MCFFHINNEAPAFLFFSFYFGINRTVCYTIITLSCITYINLPVIYGAKHKKSPPQNSPFIVLWLFVYTSVEIQKQTQEKGYVPKIKIVKTCNIICTLNQTR